MLEIDQLKFDEKGLIPAIVVDDQTALHIQKVCQHPVVQLRRENLEEGNLSDFPAHGEVFSVSEREGAGRDEVLHGKPGGSQPVPVKQKRLLFVHVEDAV